MVMHTNTSVYWYFSACCAHHAYGPWNYPHHICISEGTVPHSTSLWRGLGVVWCLDGMVFEICWCRQKEAALVARLTGLHTIVFPMLLLKDSPNAPVDPMALHNRDCCSPRPARVCKDTILWCTHHHELVQPLHIRLPSSKSHTARWLLY